jgi:hypothetical protein
MLAAAAARLARFISHKQCAFCSGFVLGIFAG